VYAALWRTLPGPVWVRILILIVLVAVVLFALVTWVFPWVDSLLGPQEGTVGP
jgi:flagellar basal body-associated protein FliL